MCWYVLDVIPWVS